PTGSGVGLTAVADLQRLSGVMRLAETGDNLDILGRLLGSDQLIGAKVHDARVPAIASATVWTCSRQLSETSAASPSCARTRDDPAAWKIGGVIAPADVLASVLRRSVAGGPRRGSRDRRVVGRHGSRGCARRRGCLRPAGRSCSRRPPTPPGASLRRGRPMPGLSGCPRSGGPGARPDRRPPRPVGGRRRRSPGGWTCPRGGPELRSAAAAAHVLAPRG